MLKLENLIKDFTHVRAVDSLNLHIRRGEIFGLLGPGGSGKSTTVRLITGLLKPTYGRILIGGVDLAQQPRHAKWLIGYIPDQPFFYPRLCGREFIEFYARLYQIELQALNHTVEELSRLFRVSDILNDPIESYSQSAKQALSAMSALIRSPSLIVLDEPLPALDAHAALVLKELLKQRAVAGAAVFLATHSPAAIQDLCDRFGVIKSGRLIAQGPSDQICLTGETSLETAFLRLTQDTNQATGRS